ncbi:MAG: glycosyltransferase family 4 protein [Candidatus Sungiibacteriota bacterium]
MEKPKVIICATAYRPLVGGSEIAIEEVARRLAGDFDFFILTARMSRGVLSRETGPEGTIIRLGIGMPFDKWLLPFLAVWHAYHLIRDFKKTNHIALWGMDISQGSLAALAIAWLMPRLPFVLTVQYGESEEYLSAGRWGLIRRAFRALLMRADYVTVISSYLQRVVRSHGYCGLCVVIPNGVDIEKFKSQKSKVKSVRNENIVMTVSRLVPKNGVDILIRAIAEVKKEIPDICCRIAGDGPERKNLEALARSFDMQDSVTFLGTVPHAELARHLGEVDVFVRMSRSEGMGNAFIEAIAAGVPVIGTHVGGIPDIIEHEKTGLIAAVDDSADCASKIIQLLRDPAYAQMLAERAQEKITHWFDWERIADYYRRVFSMLLSAEKRITIATGLFPPDIGGPATYSALLADALPQEHINVRVSYFGAVRNMPRIARHIVYFLRLLFTARGSDIIFAQDPVSVGLPAAIAARIAGARFILKVVGDYAWEQHQVKSQKIKDKRKKQSDKNGNFETLEEFQQKKYDLLTEARRAVQKFVARRADRVIVPSKYLAGIVVGWGIAEEKIAVVYNAAAVPERAERRDEAREQLGLSGIVIISVGRLVPWKGFALLIDVIADFSREMLEICLIIAGSGPEEENLRRKIQERGAEEQVRLLGAVSREALNVYFAASDIFALHSGYEGFSHTLIEAMAAGLPVIATRVGGNREVITDGVDGVLIEYGNKEKLKDALCALATNSDMRVAMAAHARTRAAQFTQERMIRETAIILKAL